MNKEEIVLLARARGEYELAELMDEAIDTQASLCVISGDFSVKEYLSKGLYIASDIGLRPALRGAL